MTKRTWLIEILAAKDGAKGAMFYGHSVEALSAQEALKLSEEWLSWFKEIKQLHMTLEDELL